MRAESAWASEIRMGACGGCVCAHIACTQRSQGQGAGERGRYAGRREENRETRTRASLPCSWGCFGVKVEVDERVQLLERERLCSFVVDEHTFPFLRGLLVALEHYHLIILDRNTKTIHASARACIGSEEREEGKASESDER